MHVYMYVYYQSIFKKLESSASKGFCNVHESWERGCAKRAMFDIAPCAFKNSNFESIHKAWREPSLLGGSLLFYSFLKLIQFYTSDFVPKMSKDAIIGQYKFVAILISFKALFVVLVLFIYSSCF